MSNYMSNTVNTVFGDKRVQFGTLVLDDGAASAWDTGMKTVNYLALTKNDAITDLDYVRYSISGGEVTIATGASGVSFIAMLIGS